MPQKILQNELLFFQTAKWVNCPNISIIVYNSFCLVVFL